ncbi:endonuclease/exonuclease/phosphatase family metal-dependent hydrolase [Kribbella orskensis]|uniref:Endonuclease/exonuclease/phosphatase family metal-dependent hydrolase n=1 Tax=Kribbella orskensis TaxID=2512216 RepID=A0ABY2BJW3_9ACTN|nr:MULTISPECIES: endonuclease/exonuclease/phosphatase family protein [Kribbella]TCN40248.1 endonuclease/exonuclease/phosphatase family metal-dependent hydrolase [Kribbella sp. VKM Ac-2500]TCO22868.1 endonuclease/exonuclease/phosphatase family metal-dependent hydrolase [Kribbella orskensis]
MRKRPKRLLVTFTGLLMLLPTAAAASPGHSDDRPGRPLKVLTYNIHHGAGTDGLLDLERIAQVIDDSGADVVGLQEVENHWSERGNWEDQAAWFARRLDLHYAFAANLDLPPLNPGEPRRQYGTAVLSKTPIRDFRNTLLPLYPTGEQRGLAVATIKVRGQNIRFANTHLTSNNNAERLEQARKVVELLAGSKTPTLLVGDLNATPEKPEITTLTAVWRDTWAEVGLGPGYTIEADKPTARIDFVLHTRTLRPTAAEVITTNGSDHLPVAATFTLR